MQPYGIDELYKKFSKLSKDIVLYLPRNSDLNQIARYAPEGKKVEVAHYCILGASKVREWCFLMFPMTLMCAQALCVYFGDFNFEGEEEEQADEVTASLEGPSA